MLCVMLLFDKLFFGYCNTVVRRLVKLTDSPKVVASSPVLTTLLWP